MVQLEQTAGQIQTTIAGLMQQQQNLVAAETIAAATGPAPITNTKPPDPKETQAERERDRVAQEQLQQSQINQRAAESSNRRQMAYALEVQISQFQSGLMQTQVSYNRLGGFVMSRQSTLRQGQLELERMARDARQSYQELGQDSQVMNALTTLNRGSAQKYALGPIDDYAANVRRWAGAVLGHAGFQGDRRGGLGLKADADLKTATNLLKTVRADLAKALARQLELRHEAEFRSTKIAAVSALLAGSPAPASTKARPAAAQLERARADLARLRKEEAEGEKKIKAADHDVSTTRETFVQARDILQMAFDASQKKRQEVQGNKDLDGALDALKKKRFRPKDRQPAPPAELVNAQKAIQQEEIALVVDRTASWVTVTVNGKPDLKFVFDPTADTVRISERFASTIGLSTADATHPVVTVTMPDGGTIRARRARLQTVALGKLTARNVECHVMLDEYDAPPVLGASYFDQYVIKVDTDSNRLTLTQVTVAPHFGKPEARAPEKGARKNSPARTGPDPSAPDTGLNGHPPKGPLRAAAARGGPGRRRRRRGRARRRRGRRARGGRRGLRRRCGGAGRTRRPRPAACPPGSPPGREPRRGGTPRRRPSRAGRLRAS